jgi:hypothetical protein
VDHGASSVDDALKAYTVVAAVCDRRRFPSRAIRVYVHGANMTLMPYARAARVPRWFRLV